MHSSSLSFVALALLAAPAAQAFEAPQVFQLGDNATLVAPYAPDGGPLTAYLKPRARPWVAIELDGAPGSELVDLVPQHASSIQWETWNPVWEELSYAMVAYRSGNSETCSMSTTAGSWLSVPSAGVAFEPALVLPFALSDGESVRAAAVVESSPDDRVMFMLVEGPEGTVLRFQAGDGWSDVGWGSALTGTVALRAWAEGDGYGVAIADDATLTVGACAFEASGALDAFIPIATRFASTGYLPQTLRTRDTEDDEAGDVHLAIQDGAGVFQAALADGAVVDTSYTAASHPAAADLVAIELCAGRWVTLPRDLSEGGYLALWGAGQLLGWTQLGDLSLTPPAGSTLDTYSALGGSAFINGDPDRPLVLGRSLLSLTATDSAVMKQIATADGPRYQIVSGQLAAAWTDLNDADPGVTMAAVGERALAVQSGLSNDLEPASFDAYWQSGAVEPDLASLAEGLAAELGVSSLDQVDAVAVIDPGALPVAAGGTWALAESVPMGLGDEAGDSLRDDLAELADLGLWSAADGDLHDTLVDLAALSLWRNAGDSFHDDLTALRALGLWEGEDDLHDTVAKLVPMGLWGDADDALSDNIAEVAARGVWGDADADFHDNLVELVALGLWGAADDDSHDGFMATLSLGGSSPCPGMDDAMACLSLGGSSPCTGTADAMAAMSLGGSSQCPGTVGSSARFQTHDALGQRVGSVLALMGADSTGGSSNSLLNTVLGLMSNDPDTPLYGEAMEDLGLFADGWGTVSAVESTSLTTTESVLATYAVSLHVSDEPDQSPQTFVVWTGLHTEGPGTLQVKLSAVDREAGVVIPLVDLVGDTDASWSSLVDVPKIADLDGTAASLVLTYVLSSEDGRPVSLENAVVFGYAGDTDGDGVGDLAEFTELGSDPLQADTDGDGVDDGLDPEPTAPGVGLAWLAEEAALLACDLGALDLSLIDAPNDNAAAGRRGAMADKAAHAASRFESEQVASAIAQLEALLDAVDPTGAHPWLVGSDEASELAERVLLVLELAEYE